MGGEGSRSAEVGPPEEGQTSSIRDTIHNERPRIIDLRSRTTFAMRHQQVHPTPNAHAFQIDVTLSVSSL
jgi:hypothetical protein